MPPLYDELVVSVQLVGHDDDPVAGHLAPGLLAAPGFVVVPDPPATLLDRGPRLAVLIVPTPVTTAARLERVPVVAVHQLNRENGQAAMLVLGLAHDSRYESTIAMHDERVVEQALHHGDVWAGLEAAGAIRAGLRELTSSVLGPRLPQVEHVQALPRWGESPVAISIWCLISPRCMPPHPHDPLPGPEEPGSPVPERDQPG